MRLCEILSTEDDLHLPPAISKDSWRGKKAVEWKFSAVDDDLNNGPGKEAVRIVGIPSKNGRLDIFYIKSYAENRGLVRQALAYMRPQFAKIVTREAVNKEFNQHMAALGLIDDFQDD